MLSRESLLAAAAIAAFALAIPRAATAAETWVVGGDLAGAMLLSQPQRSLFGHGVTGALSVQRSVSPKLLFGLRLRSAAFGDAPGVDATRADPGTGGFGAALLSLRWRPLGQAGQAERATGPWLEVGAGGGATGTLARAMGDVGLGWSFPVRRLAMGPMLRYHHVMQPGSGSHGRDAKMAFLGVEVLWSGRIAATSQPAPAIAPKAPPPAPPPPPPGDRDGDGLADPEDRCPDKAEDVDGFQDGDGCPDEDNDGDGIPDATDSCRDLPEVINGVDDGDGCPDEGIITMIDDRVVLEEEVLFKTDRARVTTRGRQALAAVMRLWRQHPEWERLDIEGHADVRGPAAYNQWLSEERASRVRTVLIELGLESGKVTAKGFGNTRPREPGSDPESLRRNRRVELVVTRKVPGPGAAPAANPSGLSPPPAAGIGGNPNAAGAGKRDREVKP